MGICWAQIPQWCLPLDRAGKDTQAKWELSDSGFGRTIWQKCVCQYLLEALHWSLAGLEQFMVLCFSIRKIQEGARLLCWLPRLCTSLQSLQKSSPHTLLSALNAFPCTPFTYTFTNPALQHLSDFLISPPWRDCFPIFSSFLHTLYHPFKDLSESELNAYDSGS